MIVTGPNGCGNHPVLPGRFRMWTHCLLAEDSKYPTFAEDVQMITKRTGETLDPTFLCRDQSMFLPDDWQGRCG